MTITLQHQEAVPGTILDGTTGTVKRDGTIVGDFIELERVPALYFASADDGGDVMGTLDEVVKFFGGVDTEKGNTPNDPDAGEAP